MTTWHRHAETLLRELLEDVHPHYGADEDEWADHILDLLISWRCADIRPEPSETKGFHNLIDQAHPERRWASMMESFESRGVQVGPTENLFGYGGRSIEELKTRAAYYWVAARWLEAQE